MVCASALALVAVILTGLAFSVSEAAADQTQRGSAGTDDGQFDGPTAISTDSSGNVYVAD